MPHWVLELGEDPLSSTASLNIWGSTSSTLLTLVSHWRVCLQAATVTAHRRTSFPLLGDIWPRSDSSSSSAAHAGANPQPQVRGGLGRKVKPHVKRQLCSSPTASSRQGGLGGGRRRKTNSSHGNPDQCIGQEIPHQAQKSFSLMVE